MTDADAGEVAARTREALAGITGTVRPVVTAPDAALSRTGEDVDPTDVKTVTLAADLLATMRASAGCVGLAAPQVGAAVRVFVVDVTGHPRARRSHGAVVLCNAVLVAASRWKVAREGCLSVPHLTGDVKRAGRVVVRGRFPGTGEPVTLAADGFEARALQHELDHCDGVLLVGRVAGAHALHPRKVYLRPV